MGLKPRNKTRANKDHGIKPGDLGIKTQNTHRLGDMGIKPDRLGIVIMIPRYTFSLPAVKFPRAFFGFKPPVVAAGAYRVKHV